MKKYVVKPTGSFILIDHTPRQVISGPTLAAYTSFVQERHACGQLDAFVGYVFPEQANHEDFKGYLTECKGDVELAVASYYSTFDLPAVDTEAYRAAAGALLAKVPPPKKGTLSVPKPSAGA